MLLKLHIQNYAIIDEVDIDFTKGLTIITGETGAGKSIILGALGLIMGKRADLKVLFNPDIKCFVEARFTTNTPDVHQILITEDLDINEELIIRREITTSGKSRAFVNDTPVNLDTLQKLSGHLIDLHQQWDNLDIHNESYQMEMLDAFAGNESLAKNYKTWFQNWKTENKNLTDLIQKQSASERENEFNQFLIDELEKLDPVKGEQATLEKDLDIASNAQNIVETFSQMYMNFEEKENSVQSIILSHLQSLSSVKNISFDFGELYDRLYSVLEELKDISREASKIADNTEFNPEKIMEIKERLNILYKLQKKHGVLDEAGLLEVYEDLIRKIETAGNLDKEIENTRSTIRKIEEEMTVLDKKLHQQRILKIPEFEKKAGELLLSLKMEHARLNIELTENNTFSVYGTDHIQWLFAANKGSALLPLKSVASGGEISRLNLCVKSIIASSMTLPTLIFDEIDAGVSGDVAKKMGDLLSQLSRNHQLICITHSPQVASKAESHYFVYKDHEGSKTLTKIKNLTETEKIHEIAVMLSSDPPSPAAMEAARELLSH
ncbi:MAG: DNA repair protein RecN [Saprospiraceae bacterium]|nr:DNA repair protein RecN [Saprospiraceae bacterium]